MKKIIYIILSGIMISNANAQMSKIYKSDKIDDKTIYFFTKDNCPYCKEAEEYITKNHKNLKIEFKNISNQENINLMIECADKFEIDKRSVGTPLICMGQHYILGWNEESQNKFDKLAIQFKY